MNFIFGCVKYMHAPNGIKVGSKAPVTTPSKTLLFVWRACWINQTRRKYILNMLMGNGHRLSRTTKGIYNWYLLCTISQLVWEMKKLLFKISLPIQTRIEVAGKEVSIKDCRMWTGKFLACNPMNSKSGSRSHVVVNKRLSINDGLITLNFQTLRCQFLQSGSQRIRDRSKTYMNAWAIDTMCYWGKSTRIILVLTLCKV